MSSPRSFLIVLLLGAAHVQRASSAFSLDVSGPDWDYTTEKLTSTTSKACRDAFSASINCDETLLGIVASMRPAFDPQAGDLDAMCTTACRDSLDAYVAKVKKACGGDGDRANVAVGSREIEPSAKVQTVGQVFQYKYAQACSKNETGYCYLNSASSSVDFDCDDECEVSFYKNAHNFPGSSYTFLSYYLVEQSDWWQETYVQGWERVQKCGGVDVSGSSATTAAASTSDASSKTADAGDSHSTGGTSAQSSVGSASSTSAASSSETPKTSGARRLRAPLAGLLLW